MRPVTATFVNNEVEPGWPILADDVPLGKRYLVDLDRVVDMELIRRATGRAVPVKAIWVLAPGPPGWLPLIALKVATDS